MRSEIGAEETDGSCLLEIVVKIRWSSLDGMRANSRSRSSVIDVVESRGSERVDGIPNPGKEVIKTFTIDGAITWGCYLERDARKWLLDPTVFVAETSCLVPA